MTPDSVETLMADIEAGHPLDFADLAIGEDEARRLMAIHFCELDRQLLEHGLDAPVRLEIMVAVAAHTMVENMLLNLARLKFDGGSADFRAWMRRHGMSD